MEHFVDRFCFLIVDHQFNNCEHCENKLMCYCVRLLTTKYRICSCWAYGNWDCHGHYFARGSG